MGVRYVAGNITTIHADIIVNAANAKVYMGGMLGRYVRLRGVAESIHYVTSGAVEREAKEVIRSYPVGEGDVYITGAYNLPAKWVVHAVTMMQPGSRSNLEAVGRCVENVPDACRLLEARTVAIPLLGTGPGRVDDVREWESYTNGRLNPWGIWKSWLFGSRDLSGPYFCSSTLLVRVSVCARSCASWCSCSSDAGELGSTVVACLSKVIRNRSRLATSVWT